MISDGYRRLATAVLSDAVKEAGSCDWSELDTFERDYLPQIRFAVRRYVRLQKRALGADYEPLPLDRAIPRSIRRLDMRVRRAWGRYGHAWLARDWMLTSRLGRIFVEAAGISPEALGSALRRRHG